jgi:nucleoside-diphosphate-sugar epimerase
VQAAARDVSVVVLRPGIVHGPRDRAALPRIVTQLAAGRFLFVADGRFRCHLVYVENLADAVVVSIECATAAGPYLVIDHPAVKVREFVFGIADGLGLPRPTLSLPELIHRGKPPALPEDSERFDLCGGRGVFDAAIASDDEASK